MAIIAVILKCDHCSRMIDTLETDHWTVSRQDGASFLHQIDLCMKCATEVNFVEFIESMKSVDIKKGKK